MFNLILDFCIKSILIINFFYVYNKQIFEKLRFSKKDFDEKIYN